MRRTALLLVALALETSCSGGGSSGPVVEMVEGHRFDPGIAVVSAGSTVTFTNDSEEAHTVTAVDGVPRYFASGGAGSEDEARENLSDGLVAPGETYEVTFAEPGTYDYFCIPHEDEGMKGTIEVGE